MKLMRPSDAGTADSGDINIRIEANDGQGLIIELNAKSVVMKQFGNQIKNTIKDVIASYNLENVTVYAQDNGALDYVIKARLKGAITRAI